MTKENDYGLSKQQIYTEFVGNFNHFSREIAVRDVVKVILYDVITFSSPGA